MTVPYELRTPNAPRTSAHTLAGGGMLTNPDPIPPTLSDEERALIFYADTHLAGAFTIGKLADAFPAMRRHRIAELAKTWEGRGWLTAPADAVSPRLITDTLRTLANPSSQTGAKP